MRLAGRVRGWTGRCPRGPRRSDHRWPYATACWSSAFPPFLWGGCPGVDGWIIPAASTRLPHPQGWSWGRKRLLAGAVVFRGAHLGTPVSGAQTDGRVEQVGLRAGSMPVHFAGVGKADVASFDLDALVVSRDVALARLDLEDLAARMAVPVGASAGLEQHVVDVDGGLIRQRRVLKYRAGERAGGAPRLGILGSTAGDLHRSEPPCDPAPHAQGQDHGRSPAYD